MSTQQRLHLLEVRSRGPRLAWWAIAPPSSPPSPLTSYALARPGARRRTTLVSCESQNDYAERISNPGDTVQTRRVPAAVVTRVIDIGAAAVTVRKAP